MTANNSNGKTTMMWAPGAATVDAKQLHIVWSGWPQNGPADGWKRDFASFTAQGQPVVLSGPFYLTPAHPAWDQWQIWVSPPLEFNSSERRKIVPKPS